VNLDISPAWLKIQALVNGFISMLPNIVLALILFCISCLFARWAKSLIIGFYGKRSDALSRLADTSTQRNGDGDSAFSLKGEGAGQQ
jgi:hypothetical protein